MPVTARWRENIGDRCALVNMSDTLRASVPTCQPEITVDIQPSI